MKWCICLAAVLAIVQADVYLHNPRGSNNRLDEARRERNNANRLFDSQNNNRGGYNVGSLYYYQGSMLSIEWTNQHSCADQNSHCVIILQYMCGNLVRDGTTTQTIPVNRAQCKKYDCNTDKMYGMHEDYDYYQKCKYRRRNQGLFTADQNLKNRKSATHTRQNPGGTRRAYECPEERDYYPNWHPSPWKDIAVMTNDATRCPFYERESENVKGRHECVLPEEYLRSKNYRNYEIPNNEKDCLNFAYPKPNGTRGVWTKRSSHNLPPPECRETDWSRDNHLGNGIGGFPNTYNWTIPNLNEESCVLRIRYNISTGEFNGWDSSTNASLNSDKPGREPTKVDVYSKHGMSKDEAQKRGFVYKQNPQVKLFKDAKFTLRLAINTNQFGRVFQDRSHTFAIRSRPANLAGRKIHNLNVRGKRGNIVQVYPAVEYDFVPNRLMMKNGDYVHFQWTGSNTNPNNNDGQGKAGTDRNNVALLRGPQYPESQPKEGTFGHWGNNYPEHLDEAKFLGFSRKDLQHLSLLDNVQYGGEMSELDDAGTYFDLNPRKVTSNGIFHYMCTRNNNFSNRGQKGKIVVGEAALASKKIGWNGGNVTVDPGKVQGVWVKRGTFSSLKTVSVEEWSKKDGEKRVEEMGGDVDVGDDYASNFLVVSPQKKITDGDKKFSVTLKVDSSMSGPVTVYKTTEKNPAQWEKVDAKIDDGVALMQQSEGGIYVARSTTNVGLVVGVVIACVIVLVIVIGTVVYFRKHPEKWTNTRRAFTNCHRSLQRTV